MNETNDFDELIKQKLNSFQQSPLKGNWEEMSALLDAEEKRKKRIAWYWISAVGTIIIGASLLVFNYSAVKQRRVSSNVAVQNLKVTESVSAQLPTIPDHIPSAEELKVVSTATEAINNLIYSAATLKKETPGKNALGKSFVVDEIVSISNSILDSSKTPNLDTKTLNDSTLRNEKEPITKLDSLPIPTIEPVNITKRQNNYLCSILAGANARIDADLSPIVGITITRKLKNGFSISTGLSYTYLSESDGNTKTITTGSSSDGFGITKQLTSIETDKTHYIVVPLYLNYTRGKNIFLLGANFYRLFNSSNLVSTYSESYGELTLINSKHTNGYYSGYSIYDIGLMIGYGRQLSSRFRLDARINYGLLSLQNTNAFDNDRDSDNATAFNRNISGQVVVGYLLFSK